MNIQMKNGDVLYCTLGSCTNPLSVPDSRKFQINNENIALVIDNVQGKNIPCFGNCSRSVPPPACSPTIVMEWVMGQDLFTIDGEKVVLNKSFLPCLYGGIIKFQE